MESNFQVSLRVLPAALCQRLDRYERGNKKAFSAVRIPTVDEERERAITQQRQQLLRERQRLAAMGWSLLATHNIHVTGKWWKGKAWTAIKVQVPAWVIERLEVFIVILGPLEEQEVKLMRAIQEAAQEKKIPRGVGPLTFEILRREVGEAPGTGAGDRHLLLPNPKVGQSQVERRKRYAKRL